MRRRAIVLACILALAASPTAARPEDQYGPPPDWERYKELAEPAIRAKLPDPDNWSIAWPNGYMKEVWRHKGRFTGYLSCGMIVAATPPPKGRSVVNFVTVIDFDRVQTVDISDRQSNSLVNMTCQDLVSRGGLPPARYMPGYAERRAIERIGIVIRIEPEGARITTVVPGAAADHAGLRSGMVITEANGIALAGLGPTMAEILKSDPAVLRLQTREGTIFELKRAP